jgi:Zn-dependent protease with chaperone function
MTYITPQLLAREQAHRRVLLLSVGALIAFSTSPIFGHHLATQADAMLAGRDHVWRICLVALHLLLAPVHYTFHILLIAGFAYAIWDRAHAWRDLRRTLGALDARVPSAEEPLAAAAQRVGLAPDRLRVVDGLPDPAFTAGFWRPHVYVSAALPEVLDEPQLEAVFAHEAAHVRRRDPARLSALRFFACMLFYVPALRRLADDLADEAEIDADDVAAQRGAPLTLASAILTLAEWAVPDRSRRGDVASFPIATTVGVQSFQRVDLLERRIHRLAGEPSKVGTHVTRRSLGGAGATLVAVWVSGLMMAHPLPSETVAASGAHDHATAVHCEHEGAFAWSHLFCLGFGAHPDGMPCPHMGT